MRAGYGQHSPRLPRSEQERLLEGAGCRRIYFDSKYDREQKNLKRCIEWLAGHAMLNSHDRATLVVCSLDRLASSIDRLFQIVGQLAEKGIRIELLRENIRGRDSDLFAWVLRFIADFRRENTADKSQRGVLVAEKRDRQTSRPAKLTEQKLQHALRKMAESKPFAEVAKEAGVSVPTLYRYKAAHQRSR